MARVYLRKTPTGFVCADELSAEFHRKYKTGEVYRADVVKPRSYQHHKLCMALLTVTYNNLPNPWDRRYPTFDTFRYAVAEAAGHFMEYVTLDGEVKRMAKSISYDAIPDDVEFGRVMGAMMTICARLLDMAESDLAGEVSKYADQNYGGVAA